MPTIRTEVITMKKLQAVREELIKRTKDEVGKKRVASATMDDLLYFLAEAALHVDHVGALAEGFFGSSTSLRNPPP